MDAKRSKDLTFTMTGHAHLDPIWLWDWREGYEMVKATFRSALDRMQESPDLVFVHSSAAQYAWMEEHPELLAEIRAAVARGQWEPVGGWWVEPDTNIPSGEALVRQGLYAQRYFEKTLGRRATVAFLPDSFGFPVTLPQIMKGAGLEYFVCVRPTPKELELPSNLFWWVGPDGTRMLSARLECYNTNPTNVAQSLERNLDWRPPETQEWVALYGVGNHGGGPTRKLIQNILDLNADSNWPTLRFGTLASFFDKVAGSDHPSFDGGLQYSFRGCYTSFSPVKRLNRLGEQTLLTAEKFATVAATNHGKPYPHEALDRAWKHVLFNQFHDVLCGTSLQSAYEDVMNEQREAIGTGERTLYSALQTIAQGIDTTRPGVPVGEAMRRARTGSGNFVADLGDGVPVVVFNPSPWVRREVVDVEVNDWAPDEMRVLDDQHQPVVHQFTRPESQGEGRKRATFLADVPPLGYRVYRLIDEPPAELPAGAPPLSATATQLENRWWRLTFDPATGALRSLFDKERSLELLGGAGAQLLVMDDKANPWGSEADHFRHLIAPFAQPELTLCEEGPVRATVGVTVRFGQSLARQEVSLYRDVPHVHGRLLVNWQEEEKTLKLAFPFALQETVATFSAPYGHVARPASGGEEPLQQWMDVTGRLSDARGVAHPYGVALLNDCKYGGDIMGGEARLTILRSPRFAGTKSRADDPAGFPRFQDQGWQEVRWALAPHVGPWQESGVVQAALDLNDPLRLVREYVHQGSLPPVASYLTVTPPDQLVVTALKQAEDGDDLILRLYEPVGRHARAEVSLFGAAFTAKANPHQIKSYRISRSGTVREVNFLEE